MLQYAITDGTARLSARTDDPRSTRQTPALFTRCARLGQQDVAFVLVRERHLADAALVALTRGILQAIHSCKPFPRTRVLVAGRADIAIAAGANGVHLSSAAGELTPAQIRSVLPGATVSVSCHTLDEVRRAHDQQASLVLFAPIFGKWLDGAEVTPSAGLEALRTACQAAPELPVFALGGVNAANAPQCLAAGAAGIAGIRLFFGDEHFPSANDKVAFQDQQGAEHTGS